MAEQAQKTAQNAGGGIEGATNGILSTVEGWGTWAANKGRAVVDRIFPPEQRSAFLAKIQSFMLKNPKISAFLGMNFALTGIPLGLFVLFTLTVAIFSLVVGIVLGLLAAVAFTVFAVGVALTIVLPTVFFTTMTACFLFLWGLGGYYILQWGNKAGKGEGAKEDGGPAIGDRLNSLTGGRLSGFMGAAKSEQAKGDMSGWSDEHTKPNAGSGGQQGEKKQQLHSQPQTNGVPKVNGGTPKKQVDNAAHKATKATGVDGAHKTAANGVGTVKGGVSGATGLG